MIDRFRHAGVTATFVAAGGVLAAMHLGAQSPTARDIVITAATLAPRIPLPSEAATANVTRFSFIAYGDTRGRRDGSELQEEHALVIESMLATIKTSATDGDSIRFVLQSGDAVQNGAPASSFRTPGIDFLKPFNALAIAIELPKSALQSSTAADAKFGVWSTISR